MDQILNLQKKFKKKGQKIMKGQEYLVRKYNEEGCNYDNRQYASYKEAWKNTQKRDRMLVCKPNSIYNGDNWQGWTVNSENVIREVRR